MKAADRLYYRFPGKEVVKQAGHFVPFGVEDRPAGFIITHLDMSTCFRFEPNENEQPGWHYLAERPYCMSAREYYLQAHELLNGLNLMQMKKAVFSRIKAVPFDESLTEKLFEKLCQTYPNALVYLLSGRDLGTWIGATPETLLQVHQDYLFTISLAGTQKMDEEREWTEKEREEQQIVTTYIQDVCERKKLKDIEVDGPYDYVAGPVKHLRTDFSAQLAGAESWDLARSLHPTPAVAGYPKLQALTLIQSVEPHRRDLYTGMIGTIDQNSTRLFVNLRCAQIQEGMMFLYLGGGYTPQSIPEMEWIETENKSKTLLNCVYEITT